MRKGLKTLILGILLFLVGAFFLPVIFIFPIILRDSEEERFLVPGEHEITVDEPGRYYLWDEYQTIFEGMVYKRSESLPDGAEVLIEAMDGEELQLVESTSTSVEMGESAKQSIGYVEVKESGVLRVTVSGIPEERVFSFSQSDFMRIFGLIAGAIMLSMILGLAGFGLGIWGIVKLARGSGNDEQHA